MSSSLILLEWKKKAVKLDDSNPDCACQAEKFVKYFAYGFPETQGSIDKANVSIILKRFGKSQIYKKNLMANNHAEAIDMNPNARKGGDSFNKQRINAIKNVDIKFADFFLKELHGMTWKNFKTGILSTIPFDEAFDMLKTATELYYQLLLASVEDNYSKELDLSNMKAVMELHNLNNEYSLGLKK